MNRITSGLFRQFVKYGLDALLKLAAILGTGHQRGHVEAHHTFVEQDAAHLALHDAQCQTLHNGRLADTRLADEHGVVLFAAAQNLGQTLYFILTADDGVETAVLGCTRYVGAEFVESGRIVGAAALTARLAAFRLALTALIAAVGSVAILVLLVVGGFKTCLWRIGHIRRYEP